MVLVTLTSSLSPHGPEDVVVDTDDPYYRAFFSSLSEVGDGAPLPESIVVPDYVLAQFPAWMSLRAWMDLGPRVFSNRREHVPLIAPAPIAYTELDEDQEELERIVAETRLPNLELMMAVVRGRQTEGPYLLSAEGLRRLARGMPLVRLADVRAIMGFLIEAPPDWVHYVVVDERSSPRERRDHYRLVGRRLRSEGIHELHSDRPGTGERLYSDFFIVNDPVYIYTEDVLRDFEESNSVEVVERLREVILNIEWLNVVQGIRHGALLTMIARGDAEDIREYRQEVDMVRMRGTVDRTGEPDWSLINWNDVIDFVPFNWFTIEGNHVSQLLSVALSESTVDPVAYAYAGRPLDKAPPQSYIITTLKGTVPRTAKTISFTLRTTKRPGQGDLLLNVHHLPLLYDRTMASLTRNDGASLFNPVQLGLSVILTKGKYRDINKSLEMEIVPLSRAPHGEYSNDVFSLLPLIHLTVLLSVPRKRLPLEKWHTDLSLEEGDFEETVALIVDTLGTRALSVMVATLLEYNGNDDKVLRFCTIAIPYVEEGTGGFKKLPS